ncbi:5-hydroxytryptamine receptor 2B [Salarias fasciatus]|uniref:5-hydroxytryptamine receptor 2B n=1 Tax=Salarias fasciatus TaxID=181472 RepID=A0A672I246_SALFA|nr:5-hydroxytryptamine receptor 2B [Salarias fasciatus]XP_029938918.1 5-hydroxytryptamine receptor 2B [Salarias fasciatus]XP_029938919.1 5-hydroxytryptamine receptor 2B [Salarias fasciatus]XP_029938920.1 5-hydroxytryptamine receptor 2B [Salarias fasciatus]
MSHPIVAQLEANNSDAGEVPEIQLKWAALLIFMVIIPTIGGNILVILAVSLEKKLQNATNYFLMSLAVADLLVGLLVMPIALITVLYNSGWPLPEFLCPIWLFLDVLFSTASIMHLCAISLDRYIAIKKPIQHSQYKSRAKAMVKIALVWLISICIAIPIPIKGLTNYHVPNNITFNSNHTCLLKTDTFREFIMFGSLAAFFVPLTIMMVIYLLTVQVLRKKVYLLRSKVTQRLSYPTVSTVLQKQPAMTSLQAEQMNMLDSRLLRMQEKPNTGTTNNPAGNVMSFRRMSTMGKKSMQTLSNEQRASKVLGIVFLLFVVMWCPFFITNITSVLCTSCDANLISSLMEIFVWVGYVSSGINPLVYTLFNKTFREAFTRYITCNYKSCTTGHQRHPTASNADWTLTGISFRSSVAENSKLFMKRGMKNGIGTVSYQSPLRCRKSPVQSCSGVALDTMLFTENDHGQHEEHVSCL